MFQFLVLFNHQKFPDQNPWGFLAFQLSGIIVTAQIALAVVAMYLHWHSLYQHVTNLHSISNNSNLLLWSKITIIPTYIDKNTKIAIIL